MIDLLTASEKYGTYHATCEGKCNWCQFTRKIYQLCGMTTQVIPVSTEEYGAAAKRPAYSMLENRMLKENFDYSMADWEDALKKYLTEKKLVKEFIFEHGFKIKPEYGAFPDRPYDSPGVWGDAQKNNEIMNY